MEDLFPDPDAAGFSYSFISTSPPDGSSSFSFQIDVIADGEVVIYGDRPHGEAEQPVVLADVVQQSGMSGSMAKLVRDLAAADKTEQDRLIAGLHQKMWHAPAGRLLPLLQAAGCPTSVLRRVPEICSSCKRCRMFAQPKHRPTIKATLARFFNHIVQADGFTLMGTNFLLLIDECLSLIHI